MSAEIPRTPTFILVFRAVAVVIFAAALGWFIYTNATSSDARFPFKLGLDLAGGSHLVYEADVSDIDPAEVPELMNVLRDVIERRINVFGVSEPIIQVERSSFVADEPKERLVVELPGVTDVSQAIDEIGRTPLLEFKLLDEDILAQQETLASLEAMATASGSQAVVGNVKMNGETIEEQDPFIDTGLTGRYLESAALEFAGGTGGQLANEPLVSVRFTPEGAQLFSDITRNNVGSQLGIFLDGEMISAPVINEAIIGGTAVISGGFTPEEARELAQNLSFGALPVPISLVSTQTIDATLGAGVIQQSILAGAIGLLAVSLFMIGWYRLPGLIASFTLAIYIGISLALFMLIPVTLTAAGLAGLILSLGMAVDANVLIFERMKEEYRSGKSSRAAAHEGFSRAWSAIRDSNITSLLSALIMFWFSTSMIKGFALVLGLGVITSMFTAIVLTRTILVALPDVKRDDPGFWSYLFGTGLTKK